MDNNNNSNNNSNLRTQDPKQVITFDDSRFNQTLRNVQGSLKGRSLPGKVLITRSDPMDVTFLHSPSVDRSPSNDEGSSKQSNDTTEDQVDKSKPNASAVANQFKSLTVVPDNTSEEVPRFGMSPRAMDTAKLMKFTKVLGDVTLILGVNLMFTNYDPVDKLRELAWSGVPSYVRPNVWRLLLDQVDKSKPNASAVANQFKSLTVVPDNTSEEVPRFGMSPRAMDTAKLMKFTKVLGDVTLILGVNLMFTNYDPVDKLRELAWSGVPSYIRPNVWRLLLGYAPTNSDRREGVLKRKRTEYFNYISQYYDVSDNERTEEEISMLRQIAVDCPRTVPEVTFFQQVEVQKSLERILYTWAIRHPASGYVQGINDLVTPFLVVFLSEHLEGSVDKWLVADLHPDTIFNIEADCYWCLTKLLDGMQDHYTFAQPGIQRLVFKLKDLVKRINEPISRHMEEQGLDFLQFTFRWFNCLLIREIPFHLVNRLVDTYLAEGDALPDFLVYISASLLLTWSDELQKLDFQEMVMFLQHLPTQNWGHQELEMVLSRAFMWHSMFNSSPSHLFT